MSDNGHVSAPVHPARVDLALAILIIIGYSYNTHGENLT